MTQLKGIVYVSEATTDFDKKHLIQLASAAAITNEEIGITGYLYYEKGSFLQYVEGEKDAVQQLMDKISRDPRHQVKGVEINDALSIRRFPSWHMQWLTNEELKGINMEKVIISYMNNLKVIRQIASNTFMNLKVDNHRVWNLMDKLSSLREQIIT